MTVCVQLSYIKNYIMTVCGTHVFFHLSLRFVIPQNWAYEKVFFSTILLDHAWEQGRCFTRFFVSRHNTYNISVTTNNSRCNFRTFISFFFLQHTCAYTSAKCRRSCIHRTITARISVSKRATWSKYTNKILRWPNAKCPTLYVAKLGFSEAAN